jgi:hypothetical protein
MGRRWVIVSGCALVLAAVWSVALMVLALVAPAYSGESSSASMEGDGATTTSTTSTTATMVQVNGVYVLFLLAIPLAITGLVALLLRFRGSAGALIGAWALTLLLGAFCFVGLMSIGLFVAPVALALVVACTTAMVAAIPVAPSEAYAGPNP